MQQTGRHRGCAIVAQGCPQHRGSTREAGSTAVRLPFSSSHGSHCFLSQVCSSSLLRKTCLPLGTIANRFALSLALWQAGCISALWKRGARVKGHGVPTLLSIKAGATRNPFLWCSWAEGLVPALWLPKPSPKPSNLLSMNHSLPRETQSLLGRNRALIYPYSAAPQKSVRLVSLTLTPSPLTQSL